MLDLVNFRTEANGLSPEAYHNKVQAVRKVASQQRLRRDEYAIKAVLDAMTLKILQSDLTLAYQYNGELYAVHKDYRNETRGGVFSTEYLHNQNLTQDQWNTLPKFHIWVSTGKVFAPVA